MRPQRPCGSTKAVEAIAGPPRARATRQPDCKRRVPALRAAAAGPSARRHSRVAPRAMLGLTRTGVAVGAEPRRRRAAASIVASSSSSSDEVKSHAIMSRQVKKKLMEVEGAASKQATSRNKKVGNQSTLECPPSYSAHLHGSAEMENLGARAFFIHRVGLLKPSFFGAPRGRLPSEAERGRAPRAEPTARHRPTR